MTWWMSIHFVDSNFSQMHGRLVDCLTPANPISLVVRCLLYSFPVSNDAGWVSPKDRLSPLTKSPAAANACIPNINACAMYVAWFVCCVGCVGVVGGNGGMVDGEVVGRV